MLWQKQPIVLSSSSALLMAQAYREPEAVSIARLLDYAALPALTQAAIYELAQTLVTEIREIGVPFYGIEVFLAEYPLGSQEGMAILCLAEALLRIPDKATVEKLIEDKLTTADWHKHLGQSQAKLVNIVTMGLAYGGDMLKESDSNYGLFRAIKNIVKHIAEPVVRTSLRQAMRWLGQQFIFGRTIEEALKNANKSKNLGFAYSFDQLGEAALTYEDAQKYEEAYAKAIRAVGEFAAKNQSKKVAIWSNEGVSIKLSALHPRFHPLQQEQVLDKVAKQLLALAQLARSYHINLTIDAEEADRLTLTLAIFEKVALDPSLAGWAGLGIAVQAYQKRAFYLIDVLAELAKRRQVSLPVRLIKGAYWDSEIKQSQVFGLSDYPVFTRKINTDLSYLACARKLLSYGELFYPQFATHNAYTVATILVLTQEMNRQSFEFQCLYGMGQTLYQALRKQPPVTCRIYAPVGTHEDLLPYLIRRLLENGANTSFVHAVWDKTLPIQDLLQDPLVLVPAQSSVSHPNIPVPALWVLETEQRVLASALDWSDIATCMQQAEAYHHASQLTHRQALSWVGGQLRGQASYPCLSPIDRSLIGYWGPADESAISDAFLQAKKGVRTWAVLSVDQRAYCLDKAAHLLAEKANDFRYLLVMEAGKNWIDADAEIRETIDFCRYYAKEARRSLLPIDLPSYTGETNQLSYHPRGIFVTISPWNFPLAIFTGQIVAALVTGNAVIAKPAEQTPLIATQMITLLHQAGIPDEVLACLLGTGESIGASVIHHPDVAGILFTGSHLTARLIQQRLAAKPGPIVPLIAETGGQNAMIVDASALPEQVVKDVVASAFLSAGQRCSALRVLFLQEEVASRILTMLKGYMATLKWGDPRYLLTDIGPVIDDEAKKRLQAHQAYLKNFAELVYQCPSPKQSLRGYFIAPSLYRITSLTQLSEEVFGPILHVITYCESELTSVVEAINATGFGLTLGIHSRIQQTIEFIQSRIRVGNCYVNRSMTGAWVGMQPFGGEGLSGTGPKAGGPNYLLRLCTERVISYNRTAMGGNTALVNLM